MVSITNIHLQRPHPAANLHSLFGEGKLIKLLMAGLTYALPEMPLSVGSKLKLLSELSLPNFRILPSTLTH